MPKCIFSVDVEDWYHLLDLPSTPPPSEWDTLPVHVERDFRRLLEIFAEKQVSVTCFFLGYIAERFPHLVREAQEAGHEIASHGYWHQLAWKQTADEFLEDISRSKDVLEQISGVRVQGYRAPGFSVTEKNPWFFEMLSQAGFTYDSSVFPAAHGHGGLTNTSTGPHTVTANSGNIREYPITVASLLGKKMCFFGGGYLRLFPYALIRKMTHQVLGENRPAVFYIHPREINPDQPRLPASMVRRFKSYVNLKTTEAKIRRILDDFEFSTFAEHWASTGQLVA